MNLNLFIEESIRESTRHVFATMLGAQLHGGHTAGSPEAKAATDGVVSFIGISGKWAGTGSLVCTPSLACRICAEMLQTEHGAVDEAVLDAVAELTNMIVGGVKTELEAHLGPLMLSIPTVIFGRNFMARSACQGEWITVQFSWDGDPMAVRLCLSSGKSAAHEIQRLHNGTQRFAVSV